MTTKVAKIEQDLVSWDDWPTFHANEGVPGCRLPKGKTTREIAEILVTTGIDGYDGSVATDNTHSEWIIRDVSGMRTADRSYSPDL